MTASFSEETPQYFALYAQNDLSSELDVPIPKFNNRSLRELVEKGEEEQAENWLKHSEFSLFKLVYEQYGDVKVTADFNTPRRRLGLPFSPFVTGGEKRESKLTPIQNKEKRPHVVLEEEIPIYESLGFTPENINDFYTKDIITFYKEKTTGKSEGTERKYRNSLYDIREALEIYSKQNWEECDLEIWRTLLSEDFFEMNYDVSKTMVKDLITVVKAFSKWLVKEKKLPKNSGRDIENLAKEFESSMLNAVQLFENENSYTVRAYYPELSEISSKMRQIGQDVGKEEQGVYQIISVNKASVRVENLDNGEKLTISLGHGSVPYAEEGMKLSAKIAKNKTINTWRLTHLEKVTL